MVVVLLKNDLEFLTVEKFSRIFLLALKNSRCASFKVTERSIRDT